jgi:hypothetical protein
MEPKIINKVNLLNFTKLFIAFCRFSMQMKREQHLIWKSPLELMKQMLAGRSVVAFRGWKIICHVTVWHLTDNWYECGTMWTDPSSREKGLAQRVMQRLLECNQDKLLMLTSTNVVSQRLARSVTFQAVKFNTLPQAVHKETCICDEHKTGVTDQMLCQIKDRKCVCFVKLAN